MICSTVSSKLLRSMAAIEGIQFEVSVELTHVLIFTIMLIVRQSTYNIITLWVNLYISAAWYGDIHQYRRYHCEMIQVSGWNGISILLLFKKYNQIFPVIFHVIVYVCQRTQDERLTWFQQNVYSALQGTLSPNNVIHWN